MNSLNLYARRGIDSIHRHNDAVHGVHVAHPDESDLPTHSPLDWRSSRAGRALTRAERCPCPVCRELLDCMSQEPVTIR